MECVKDLAAVFGAERPVGFAREITKTFETIKKMTLGELVEFVANDHNQQKGEIVLVIGGSIEEKDLDQENWINCYCVYYKTCLSKQLHSWLLI